MTEKLRKYTQAEAVMEGSISAIRGYTTPHEHLDDQSKRILERFQEHYYPQLRKSFEGLLVDFDKRSGSDSAVEVVRGLRELLLSVRTLVSCAVMDAEQDSEQERKYRELGKKVDEANTAADIWLFQHTKEVK